MSSCPHSHGWEGTELKLRPPGGHRSEPFPLTGLLDLQRKDMFFSSPDVHRMDSYKNH